MQSWWIAWSLDHVLYQTGLSLLAVQVLPDVRSDHYPIELTLCNRPASLKPPELRTGDLERAERDIELAIRSASEAAR